MTKLEMLNEMTGAKTKAQIDYNKKLAKIYSTLTLKEKYKNYLKRKKDLE